MEQRAAGPRPPIHKQLFPSTELIGGIANRGFDTNSRGAAYWSETKWEGGGRSRGAQT